MIRYEDYVEIHLLHRQGKSLREIAYESGKAVNTVRKYLASQAKPQGKARPPRVSKLAGYTAYLAQRIAAAQPDWIPVTVLYREISARGYRGGIRLLQAYLKGQRPVPRPDPVVRFETPAGHQMRVDWIELHSARHREGRLAALVATLGFSRASYIEFVTDEESDTLIACHDRAFQYFGGVVSECLYDNVKTVILKRDAYGPGQHQLNPAFLDFAKHYGFRIRVCRPYRAQTKGKVERMNRYLRHSFWIPLRAEFKQQGRVVDAAAANQAVARWLREVCNARVHRTTRRVPWEALAEERAHLQPLPFPYQGKPIQPRSRRVAEKWDTLTPPQHSLAIYDAILTEAYRGAQPVSRAASFTWGGSL